MKFDLYSCITVPINTLESIHNTLFILEQQKCDTIFFHLENLPPLAQQFLVELCQQGAEKIIGRHPNYLNNILLIFLP